MLVLAEAQSSRLQAEPYWETGASSHLSDGAFDFRRAWRSLCYPSAHFGQISNFLLPFCQNFAASPTLALCCTLKFASVSHSSSVSSSSEGLRRMICSCSVCCVDSDSGLQRVAVYGCGAF